MTHPTGYIFNNCVSPLTALKDSGFGFEHTGKEFSLVFDNGFTITVEACHSLKRIYIASEPAANFPETTAQLRYRDNKWVNTLKTSTVHTTDGDTEAEIIKNKILHLDCSRLMLTLCMEFLNSTEELKSFLNTPC